MATRQDLENKISDDLVRSDLAAQITDAVDIAIKAYQEERFLFNEVSKQSVTLSSSTAQLALSAIGTLFYDIDRLRLLRSATDYIDLYRRDRDWIMSRQDAITYAQPAEYCLYAERIEFDSYAGDDYTLVIDGVKSLSSSESYSVADTSAWFNAGRELIRHRARREIYMHVLKDGEMAGSAKIAEDDAYQTLKGKLTKHATTGYLRPSEF